MKYLAHIGQSRAASAPGSNGWAPPSAANSGSSRGPAISGDYQTISICAPLTLATATQLHPLSIGASWIAVVEPPIGPSFKRADRADISLSPRMLTKELAAAYCGVSPCTFSAICPVTPIAMGKGDRLRRYDIRQLDRWIDGLRGGGEHCEPDWLAEMDRDDGIGRSRKRH